MLPEGRFLFLFGENGHFRQSYRASSGEVESERARMKNQLYFGDNLDILREKISSESVDLVYLDPPFNSNARYNVLFQSSEDKIASAQAEAFRDTWTWNEEAEWAFSEVARIGGTLATFVNALHSALGRSDLMAYLVMMAVRLHELRRILKPSGSLYLHCDPTASHYLKLMLDGIFGPANFRNEIIWRRTNAHNVKTKAYPRVHDTILFVTRSSRYTWNKTFLEYSPEQLGRYKADESGRLFTGQDLTMMGGSADRKVEWRGTKPPGNRAWGASIEQLEAWWEQGLILTKKDGTPRLDGRKVYLDEKPGKQTDSLWTDIQRVGNTAAERLGYPTQKPLALLERILAASSAPGDVVLDPFCGCGTTVHAAQQMKRQWVGIDVAYHAVEVISERLGRHFGLRAGDDFELGGKPNDLNSAARLAERDKYQFQWWANYLVGVQQMREVRRGADQGIDGEIYFMAGPGRGYGRILTSVKGGRNVGVSDVRDFRGVLERERADAGIFICLRRPTRDMRQNAVSAGFFSIGASQYPRLQIVSIEEWYEDGQRPLLPTTEHLARRASVPVEAAPAGKKRKPDPRQREMMFGIEGILPNNDPKVFVNPRFAADLAG